MSEQLFIFDHDYTELPIQHHLSHNITVRVHDQLVDIIKDKSVQRKLNIKIDFKEGDIKPSENEEDIISWLLDNGWSDIANHIFSINLVLALTSDICHFIYQSLHSSKKYKMSVAYTLVRKPFLENLIILEQLLCEESDFLERFSRKPEDFDPGKLNEKSRKDLIEKSLQKIKSAFLDNELIYDIRFEKKNENSLYAMTNIATHLVTTRHPVFKTEKQNLNFIFSGLEEWDSQHQHYYYFIPYLLFYTAEVIDKYLLEKKIITLKYYKKRKFYRFICQIIQHDQFDEKSLKGKSPANRIFQAIKVKCKNCNKQNQLYKSDFYSLIQNNYILCKHCLVDLYYESESMNHQFEKFL
jgi:hypothetical protein